jgi:CubicO group peptidase (beta-lactamase class C family)
MLTRNFLGGLTLTILTLWNETVSAQPQPNWESLKQSVAEHVQTFEREKGFSGVVLLRIGEADEQSAIFPTGKQNATEANSAATLFEIGSCTKPITAAACLRLQQRGQLSLDDPINKHLNAVPEHSASITIRHLLQHTSGVAGTNYGVPTEDSAEFVRACLVNGPQRPPGSQFEYWNQGYGLLAAIIEQVSGKSYMDAVRELVFEPAGMRAACFTGDDHRANVAIGKSSYGPARSAIEHPYAGFYGYQYNGMGGAVMTAGDLDRFITAIVDPEFLTQESSSKMISAQPHPYGLGWFVAPIGTEHIRVFHTGSVRGFLASVSWYPRQPCRLIVLANDDNRDVFFELEGAIRRQLESVFVPSKFDPELVKAISGNYTGKLSNGRMLWITISGDSRNLSSTIDWGGGLTGRGSLEPGVKDQLWLVDGSPEKAEIKLEYSADGKTVEAIHFLKSRFLRSE